MKTATYIRITSGKVEVSGMEKPEPHQHLDKFYQPHEEDFDKALEAFNNSFVEVSNPYEWLFTPPFHKKEDVLTEGLFNVEGKNWTFEVMEMDSADGTESEKLATISFQDPKPQEPKMYTRLETISIAERYRQAWNDARLEDGALDCSKWFKENVK
jgi:hypothetical protein